jgi:hypothetical protein
MKREKKRLEGKLKRLWWIYSDDDVMTLDEYRREKGLAQARLASLRIPEQEELTTVGEQVEGMAEAWKYATEEERRDMMRLMLDGLYVNVDDKQAVGLVPKPAFLPLFGLDEPLRSGDMLLTTELTGGGLDPGRGRHPFIA